MNRVIVALSMDVTPKLGTSSTTDYRPSALANVMDELIVDDADTSPVEYE